MEAGVPKLLQFGDESEGSKDRDRLSELPNSLILLILSFLPTVDVVRTSVLSKQWKDLWTTIPVLDFGMNKFVPDHINCSNNCINGAVTRTLQLWRGTNIVKFRVALNSRCSPNSIGSWLDFAMDHGAEELSVTFTHYFHSIHYYRATPRLFSYSAITKLCLWYCDFMIGENVIWDRLRHLEINVLKLKDHVIDKILCGAPQLEVLDLEVRVKYRNLIIQSSSLKRLTIVLNEYFRNGTMVLDEYFREEVTNTSLRIWAPNLQSLQIFGVPCRSYLVMDLSSVKDLTLDLDHGEVIGDHGEVIEEMVRQFFPIILRAEKVTLSKFCMEAVAALGWEHLLSSSPHIKFLEVSLPVMGVLIEFESLKLETLIRVTTCTTVIFKLGSSKMLVFLKRW